MNTSVGAGTMNCVETAEVGAVAGGAVVMTIPTVSNVRETEAGDVVTVPESNQVQLS